MKPRLLPCAVAAMALLAAVKAATLVRSALLERPSPARIEILPTALASPPPAPAAPSAPHGGGHGSVPAAPAAAPPPAPPPPPAEPAVSEAERTLLMDLRSRRAELDKREQAMAAREGLVAAAERRLAARVDELASLQSRLEALEGTRRERDEANWRGLVKTYETMRPRDAAAILNELEMPVLLQVLDRMKEAKAAPVLAAMQPDRARAATTQLAQMRTRQVTPAPAAPAQPPAPPSAPPAGADAKPNG